MKSWGGTILECGGMEISFSFFGLLLGEEEEGKTVVRLVKPAPKGQSLKRRVSGSGSKKKPRSRTFVVGRKRR